MKGRKKVPRALKLLKGTLRLDRLNVAAPEPEAALPVAPSWLPKRAAEIFATLTARLAAQRLASASHTETLALWALRLHEVEKLTAIIEREGGSFENVSEGGGTMHRLRPEVAQRNEAMRHAQALAAEFGQSPATAERVSAPPAPVSNEWAELQARYFTPAAAPKGARRRAPAAGGFNA